MINNNNVDHVDKRIKKDNSEASVDLFSTVLCEERVDEKECYTQEEQREKKQQEQLKMSTGRQQQFTRYKSPYQHKKKHKHRKTRHKGKKSKN